MSERSGGLLAMIVSMSTILLVAYFPREGGMPSAKVNGTLFFSGLVGFVIVSMGLSANALAGRDKLLLGLVAGLTALTVETIDFATLLAGGGRVTVPLAVAVAVVLLAGWKRRT